MSYTTPHHAHEFMKAAALGVVHTFVLACQRKMIAEKRALLLRKREIDFNSALALYFGPEASISAQGVKDSDLRIKSPTLEVEIKYCRPNPLQAQPANPWDQVIGKDWKWLLNLKAPGDTFKKTAWVIFLPSVELFDFSSCFQVPKKNAPLGSPPLSTFAPFVGLVGPSATKPRQLEYLARPWPPDAILQRQGVGAPIRVRRQIIGDPKHPIWALVLSRLNPTTAAKLNHLKTFQF
jgi:hypothetical protein